MQSVRNASRSSLYFFVSVRSSTFSFLFEEKWRNGKQGAERASESARLNDTDLASLKIARLMNRLEGHPFRSEQKGVKQ